MKAYFITILIAGLIIYGTAYHFANQYASIITTYQDKARTPLFSAFVTVGSFLLTLKTTVLQRLKDGFDSQAHKQAYESYQRKGGKESYYSSLCNMSTAIACCVFSSLLTSAVQMTLGFISDPWAFGLCVAAPSVSLFQILILWFEITKAHQLWLQKIEEDRNNPK